MISNSPIQNHSGHIATLRKDEPSRSQCSADEAQVKPVNPDELTSLPPETKKQIGQGQEEAKAEPASRSQRAAEPPKDIEKPKEFRIDSTESRAASWPCPGPSVVRTLPRPRDSVLLQQPIQGISGPIPGEAAKVHGLRFGKSAKKKILIEDVERFALSFDRVQAALTEARHPRRCACLRHHTDNHRTSQEVATGVVPLGGLRVQVDPPQEWKQIFKEVWRQERDFFFEKVE